MSMATVENMTLGDIVTDNAVRFPDVNAYRHGHRAITHAQSRARGVRLVSAMAAAGVRRQDRIAVLSRNSIEFGELNAAAQLSGIIMATINFRLSPPEMDDTLRRVAPSIVFCAEEFMPVLADLVAGMPSGPMLVTIGGQAGSGITGYERFVEGGRSGEPELVARPDDIAYLLFTSGTTGASKCCILGQREMRRVAFTMNNEMPCGGPVVGRATLPM